MRCMQNLGKHAPVLLLVPICLNLASQIITCYYGNVKTKKCSEDVFFFPGMDVVKVMVWIPEKISFV